ncbi:transcriptional regulator [Candidatus Micrarchaeota archaeon]|nr:transcriptional regulator [Candidatus Micrarchaeota archaeon]MBU2476259.1 transcriptional regulator [Candidatus Micrarchaeota archaeon]
MALKFPCEIIGWTVLPSIRRELTLYLVEEKKIERKKVCNILDLTPAALSQYLKGKRGKGVNLTRKQKEKIHKMADSLFKGKKSRKKFILKACEVCKIMRKGSVCN